MVDELISDNLEPFLAPPNLSRIDIKSLMAYVTKLIKDCVNIASSCKTIRGNLEQYSLSAISALAERAVAALVPRGSNQVRVRHQPQDCQGARSHHPAGHTRHRR